MNFIARRNKDSCQAPVDFKVNKAALLIKDIQRPYICLTILSETPLFNFK